ncbi:MAG: FAD-binding protein [Candidatus Eremiobacteraeota bacterium]|nr:FAD-binding protein [Candidatus Eremiobacteraeota bacterium]
MTHTTRSVVKQDVAIVGAGPVGLMCAYLAKLWGLSVTILDKSEGPLEVGRADALNARTLQLLEIVGLFKDLYPMGKTCNTSSVWANGRFVSRQSEWWDSLEGCLHKHFLMLGQAHVEQLLDRKLTELQSPVLRRTEVRSLEVSETGCRLMTSDNQEILARYVIGADGSRSWVRDHFKVPFSIERPQIVWAVVDGVLETDFPKVPEIIVFQNETSDVAWIPREGDIDRFYIRMDRHDFTFEEALERIRLAVRPHQLNFARVEWFSQFSVRESVAAHYSVDGRVFLAGDACHIHSVNGGQGLNTGLADAFNLIWKLGMVINGADPALLNSYEAERRPVALGVIESSGELVRATKFSEDGTHATDYVGIVKRKAGFITGMGIDYGQGGLEGSRFHDFEFLKDGRPTRAYSSLDYTKPTLFLFGRRETPGGIPDRFQVMQVEEVPDGLNPEYLGKAILVRPDDYIEAVVSLERAEELASSFALGKLQP